MRQVKNIRGKCAFVGVLVVVSLEPLSQRHWDAAWTDCDGIQASASSLILMPDPCSRPAVFTAEFHKGQIALMDLSDIFFSRLDNGRRAKLSGVGFRGGGISLSQTSTRSSLVSGIVLAEFQEKIQFFKSRLTKFSRFWQSIGQ